MQTGRGSVLFSRSKRERETIRTKIAYKRVFGTDDGRRVLLDLMTATNTFTSTYSPEAKEPIHDMLLAEGARTLVNRILAELGADLEEYIKMFDEAEEASIYDDEK